MCAVPPDGKWIAFTRWFKDYSDLMLMPASGGAPRVLRSGNGTFVNNPGFAPKATYFWYAQPAWAPDSEHLLFVSDLDKFNIVPGVDAFQLDPEIFSISINDPAATPQKVAYSTYGDGGLRDPAYRPGIPIRSSIPISATISHRRSRSSSFTWRIPTRLLIIPASIAPASMGWNSIPP